MENISVLSDTSSVQSNTTITIRVRQDLGSQNFSSNVICLTLNDQRKNGEFCDVKMVVEGVEYPAHKNVLASFSPVLKAMFTGEFTEKNQSAVNLSNVERSVMENILEYAYTASTLITVNNAQSILDAANYLQAVPLFEECSKFLEANINAENCLGLINLAEVYLCTNLREKAEKFILQNFSKICRGSEFLELSAEKLIKLISNDALKVKREDVVFVAVLRWFQHKEDIHLAFLEKVMSHVRLAYVDSYFLRDAVRSIRPLCKSASFMRLVEEANMFNLLSNRRAELQTPSTRRRFNGTLFDCMHLSGETGLRPASTPFTFLFTEDGKIIEDFAVPEGELPSAFTLSPSNSKLLAETGRDGQRLWLYDFKNDLWDKIAPLVEKRADIVYCEADGYWYAVGGRYHDLTPSNTVERFSSHTKTWKKIAPLPKAVWRPAVAALEGMLFVLGGYDKIKIRKDDGVLACNLMQRYDPRSRAWRLLPSFPAETVVSPKACAMNRRIYACSPSLKREMHGFNLVMGQWEHCSEMIHEFVHGPIAMNGNIFVISCKADQEKVLERYSPITDTWEVFACFPGSHVKDLKGPFLFSSKGITAVKDRNKLQLLTN